MELRRRLGMVMLVMALVVVAPVGASAGVSEWVEGDGGTWWYDEGQILMVATVEAACTNGASPLDLHRVATPSGRDNLQRHIDGQLTLYDAPTVRRSSWGRWCPVIAEGGDGPEPTMVGEGTSDVFTRWNGEVESFRARTVATMVDADGVSHRVRAQVAITVVPAIGEENVAREWIKVHPIGPS